MLDLRWLVENQSSVKKMLESRKDNPNIVDTIISKDAERRSLIEKEETLRSKRNSLAKEIGQKKRNKEPADQLLAESKSVNLELDKLGTSLSDIQVEIKNILLTVPNMLDKSVPVGKDESENQLVRSIGTPTNLNFEAKDHHDLGVNLGILDFENSSKIAGARFNTLRNKGAKLNRALVQFMLDVHTNEHGFEEFIPPLLVNPKSMEGTSQLPKFAEDAFHITEDDLYLIPTSEVPLTNFHRDEILDESDLPLKYTAYTPCFRREAGSYGKDTRGLIRQHQFEKVEMVLFTHPNESEQLHEKMVSFAENILKKLELPFRTMLLCSGDTGFGAAKCFDIEVWLPEQKTYREISSCSNFFDFQARRANIRFRPKEKGKPQFVHTLNGSGLAIGRTLLAVLENYQQEDGSILIPKVLQKYTGFDRIGIS